MQRRANWKESPDDQGIHLRQILKERGLFVSNPHLQGNIVERVPRDVKITSIENRYDYEPGVRCSVCPQRQLHKRGVTLKLSDGTIAVCGNKCVDKQFGEGTWAQLENALNKRENVAIFEGRIQEIVPALRKAYAQITGWERLAISPDEFRNSLNRHFPKFFSSLYRLAKSTNKELKFTKMRFDPVTEKPIEETQSLGRIPGYAFVISSPKTDIIKAKRKLEQAIEVACQAQPTVTYQKFFRMLDDVRSHVENFAESYEAAARFCLPENLRLLQYFSKLLGASSEPFVFSEATKVLSNTDDAGEELAIPSLRPRLATAQTLSLLSP